MVDYLEIFAQWEKSIHQISSNLTTNNYMPQKIIKKLLANNLINDLNSKELSYPSLCQELNIEGMKILSGLQNLKKEGNFTFYRAIRFPTFSRITNTVYNLGLSMSNYEQERILELYTDPKYKEKRKTIQKDPNFWTQPQERVVDGVPIFSLVNDALQIHRAYRNEKDLVLMIGIHIPQNLIDDKLELIANTPIDLNYNNSERDFKITDFQEKEGYPVIDYKALRVRGIDLHEMYIKGLPFDLNGHKNLGIEQRFFLLNIYQVENSEIRNLAINLDTDILKKHEYFMHGFFGDQNVFGRSPTKYLPFRCYEITKQ